MITQPRRSGKTLEQAEKAFGEVFSEKAIQLYQKKKIYHRLFTPLWLIWCLILQRLNGDHSCEAVDQIDPQPGKEPVSKRICSQSNAGFCTARKQLPEQVLRECHKHCATYARSLPTQSMEWWDRAVYRLDGSTILARPTPELVRLYGQHKTRKQRSYGVVIRIVGLFCLQNGVMAQLKEGNCHTSQLALAQACLPTLAPQDLCVADRGCGRFRIVQAVRHYPADVLVRQAHKLHKSVLYPGYDIHLSWTPSAKDTLDPHMSAEAVQGRLLFVRIERPGFRSQDVYLFTTLLDRSLFTRDRWVQLYGLRWHVQLNLCHFKRTLDLHSLSGKSQNIIRKELLAGALAYNLVRVCMLLSAIQNNLCPLSLSVAQCLRRVSEVVSRIAFAFDLQSLLSKLANCTLPFRAAPRVDPRWVRPSDNSFPEFWKPRRQARVAWFFKRFSASVC